MSGVFIVNAQRVPQHHGERLGASAQQLARPFVKADAGAHGIIRFFVQIEQVFHPRDELGVGLRDAPLFLRATV
jgi:hypothetical protein